MRGFHEYLSYLNDLLVQVAHGTLDARSVEVHRALNGGANDALHRLVSREELRDSGVFFTGSRLSDLAVRSFAESVDASSIILDPACGAGDLLLAAMRLFESSGTIQETIASSAGRLMGRDLFREFVDSTRLRLTLAAFVEQSTRGEETAPVSIFGLPVFTGIEQTCGLTDAEAVRTATHIVMNPPFAQVEAPVGCEWATGKVNAAALFVDECLKHAKKGTRIVAILPDVLRSGSRYDRWRKLVTARGVIESIDLCGQFDSDVDVDVFLLHLKVEPAAPISEWHGLQHVGDRVVQDFFSVCIGPVVDYRDPHVGESYPFVTSKGLPTWNTVTNIEMQRHFTGRVFTPPFVVVRRTSRRGDTYRAMATLISTQGEVAVENHLVVLEPHGPNKLHDCMTLLKILRNRRTNSWLDQRIRCRHLTVGALRDIPWIEG